MQTMEIAAHDKGLRLFWLVGLNGKGGLAWPWPPRLPRAPGRHRPPTWGLGAKDWGRRGNGVKASLLPQHPVLSVDGGVGGRSSRPRQRHGDVKPQGPGGALCGPGDRSGPRGGLAQPMPTSQGAPWQLWHLEAQGGQDGRRAHLVRLFAKGRL